MNEGRNQELEFRTKQFALQIIELFSTGSKTLSEDQVTPIAKEAGELTAMLVASARSAKRGK